MRRRPRTGVGPRVTVALLLTLGPTAGLAAIGHRAVAERERGLRVSFTATAVLVRDRVSGELMAQESALAGAVPHTTPAAYDRQAWQAILRGIEHDHTWLADPYLARADGGLLTADIWLEWPQRARSAPGISAPDAVAAMLLDAESAEFQKNDLEQALRQYRRAVSAAEWPRDRLLPLARVGRTLYKLKRFDEGLLAYRSILALDAQAPGELDGHGVPFQVIARAEIYDGLDALGRAAERERAGVDLRREVADHPWDAADGYGYYVKLALERHAAPDTAIDERLAARARAAALIERLARDPRPRLDVARPRLPRLSTATADNPPMALGYTIRPDTVAGSLLAQVVRGVELGGDVQVVIRKSGPETGPPVLASADFGDQFPGWQVAIVDTRGRTIEQLTSRERWAYGGLVAGVLSTLLVGLAFMTRAWMREAELSRLRRDFVSTVSHELKTPLALIRMFGETLESGLVADPDRRQEFYGIIRRESERLTHLINNVLDAARIEAGARVFTLAPGDLVSLVREVLDAYAPLFSRLNFSVDASLPDAPVPVAMDRDAVAQALVNLFQNVIQHAGEAKHLGIAVAARASEAVVTVSDHGIGISVTELPRIFDRFYRSGTTDAPGTTGSGLGLSIVQHTMTAHGGRVEVESAIGRGSAFTLVFPIARSAV